MLESAALPKPDRRRPEPLWHQVELTLRDLIERGEWSIGSQIPNEDRLSEMFGISRITVRHALRNLEASGFVRREHGRGTFVRGGVKVVGMRGLTSFTEEMHTLALSPSTTLVDAREVSADEEVAEALQITTGDPVIRLHRLRLGDNKPIGIQVTHLPAFRVPGLVEEAGDIQSLYAWLKERHDITPVHAREVYRVGSITESDADLIGQPAGTPAFEVHRITYDARGVFEFGVSTLRADRYEIRSAVHVHPRA